MADNHRNGNGSGAKCIQVVLSRRALIALGIIVGLPWLVVAAIVWKPLPASEEHRSSSDSSMILEGKKGLWGQLHCLKIATEMPNEFAFVVSNDTKPQRWFFKGYSPEKATAFLQAAGLSPDQVASLVKPDALEVTPNGCWISPDNDLVLGMKPETRARIYLELTHYTENKAQRSAFIFYPDRLNARLESSELSDKSRTLFRDLLYRQGKFLLFADLAHALPRLADDDERRRFIKMVSRKTTLLVKLKVDSSSDIEHLVAYWGIAGRAKDLRPLLASLAGIKGGGLIDVVHLLPPFARARLYTYPMVSANASATVQDCNWTTMNFFNLVPDDRFSDMEYLSKKLQEEYFQISLPEHLGDLVFLTLPSGESVHSAVFIADGIVFTKNGESVSQPWILMKLDDLIELYSAPYPPDEPLKPLFYRRKTL